MKNNLEKARQAADEAVKEFAPFRKKMEALKAERYRLQAELDNMESAIDDLESSEDYIDAEITYRRALKCAEDAEIDLSVRAVQGGKNRAQVLRTFWDQDGNRVQSGEITEIAEHLIRDFIEQGIIAPL